MNRHNSTSSRPNPVLWWSLALGFLAIIAAAWSRPELGADAARAFVAHLFPALTGRQVHLAVAMLRKAAHVIGYGLFTLILTNAILSLRRAPHTRADLSRIVVISALLALFVAILDERLQMMISFRSGAGQDVGIDFLGILAGVLFRLCRP
ncbi:MAG: VanZ family protein [Clostridia bacterium]|nr:VanZ family protein [Clostridia bacterium]